MGAPHGPELADRDLLARWHHDEGVTLTEIARQVGCNTTAVTKAMRRHGLEVRPYWAPPPPELADEAWLRDQCIDQRRSMETIAHLLHVSAGRVRRSLVRHGLYEPPSVPEPEPDPELDLPAHWRFLDEV